MRKKIITHPKIIQKAPPKVIEKPIVPPFAVWTCQPQGTLPELTVGEKFTINCTGTTDGINTSRLEIKDKDLSSEIPSLSLLESKVEGTTLKFVVTSYRAGAHKTDEVSMWDGEKKIGITGFEWTVKSILKQDPANPPQPFPAFSMIRLGYPIWIWVLLAAVLVALIGGPYWQFNRFKKRKKQFDDLKNLDSVLNPIDQFFKENRKLEKNLDREDFNAKEFSQELLKILNVYFSRSLQLPVYLWSTSQSLREIKRKYPKVYRDYGQDIQKYFSEIIRTKKQLVKKDCVFLQNEGQKIVENIDTSLEKHYGDKK